MFLVSGEALMDVYDAGPTANGQLLDARIGGSPLNVAIGLARMGQEAAFFGGIGKGFLGERLCAAMAAEGVNLAAAPRLAAPTTLGLVGLDAQGVADYAFYADGAADRLLLPEHLAALPQAKAYHFGSYAMVIEPTGSTLRALAKREAPRALVAYDLNVRLNVEPNPERWAAVLQAMLPCTHLLKLSDEDFERLFPHAQPGEMAQRWLSQGVRAVVMTRGAKGSTVWSARGRVDAPAQHTDLVDTVGAGDTFQAALLTALAETSHLSGAALAALSQAAWGQLLRFAAEAAAIACSRRGADLPRRAELRPITAW